jgi:hypothetical protein
MLDCVTEELVMSLELGEGEEEVVYDWPPTLGSTSKIHTEKARKGLKRHESRENIIKIHCFMPAEPKKARRMQWTRADC